MINGDVINIPFRCKNEVLELNRKNLECNVRRLEVDGIVGMSNDENNCYIVGRGKNSNYLYYSNKEMKKFKKIKICEEISSMSVLFWPPICDKTKNEIYLFPFYAKHIYKVNISKRSVDICKGFEDGCLEFGKEGFWSIGTTAIKVIGEKIIFMTGRDFKWHIYDMKTEEKQEFSINLPEDFAEEQFKRIITKRSNENIYLNERKFPFKVFLNAIIETKQVKEFQLNIGSDINNVICNGDY